MTKARYLQSGGLVYHFKALQYRHRLWANYLAGVRSWLHSWSPQEKNLILVGPSLGWSLDLGFLQRFESILAFEPDPWSRWLFSRRFPQVKVHWRRVDLLNPLQLESLHRQQGDHCLLFCNVLGQIPLIYQDLDMDQWQKEFRAQLKPWSWASYHDIYSGQASPASPALLQRVLQLESFPTEKTIGQIFARNLKRLAQVQDHLTGDLFAPFRKRPQYLLWELRPGQIHLIEFLKND